MQSSRRLHLASPLSFKVTTGAHEGHALVHDNLSNPQVVIDPFADFLVFRYLLGADTGAVLLVREQHEGMALALIGS